VVNSEFKFGVNAQECRCEEIILDILAADIERERPAQVAVGEFFTPTPQGIIVLKHQMVAMGRIPSFLSGIGFVLRP